jgi:hypothetical protein
MRDLAAVQFSDFFFTQALPMRECLSKENQNCWAVLAPSPNPLPEGED